MDEHKMSVLEEARAELNNVLPILPAKKCYEGVSKAIDSIDGVLQAAELEQSANNLDKKLSSDGSMLRPLSN